MLELNKWFFVLLVNFLVLLYVLNIILFKPFMKLFDDRKNSIQGALEAARDMQAKREEALLQMDNELKAAREKARQLYEGMVKDGVARQKEMLDSANKEAHRLMDDARLELKSEAEKAGQKLRSNVSRFSDEIVRKLIGA